MKKLLLLLLFGVLTTAIIAQSGKRYLEPIFSTVEKSTEIAGNNATIITLFDPNIRQAINIPLPVDIYKPVGDTETKRPLVVYLHTGNFLPIGLNRAVVGTRADSSNVEICKRLASMGYVTAAVSYRLGWNPEAQTQPLRALGLIQAAYRGIQDARTTIRYLKKHSARLGVDSTKIVLWGQGTGGYISLAAATWDRFSEIATTTNPPDKFLTDLDGDPSTLEPMVIPAYFGDTEAKTYGVVPPTGLPPIPPNDTLCYPNHVNNTSDFALCVNMGGALADISWLEAGDVPMISFQIPNDQFAPYQDAVLVVPTTGDPIVQVQGGLTVMTKVNTLNNNKVFVDQNFDDKYTQAAKRNSASAGHTYQEGLYPFTRPLNPFGRSDGSPWEWWNPKPWDTIIHPNGMGVLTYHQVALLTNHDMSKNKALAHIDTIIGFYAPRACVALNLGCDFTATENLTPEKVNLTITPNPARDYFVVKTGANYPMEKVEIFDIRGQRVFVEPRVNNTELVVHRNSLPKGFYFIKTHFERGVTTGKIIFD